MCFSDMAPVVVLAEVLVSAIAGGGGADVHSLVGLGLFGWKIFWVDCSAVYGISSCIFVSP